MTTEAGARSSSSESATRRMASSITRKRARSRGSTGRQQRSTSPCSTEQRVAAASSFCAYETAPSLMVEYSGSAKVRSSRALSRATRCALAESSSTAPPARASTARSSAGVGATASGGASSTPAAAKNAGSGTTSMGAPMRSIAPRRASKTSMGWRRACTCHGARGGGKARDGGVRPRGRARAGQLSALVLALQRSSALARAGSMPRRAAPRPRRTVSAS